MKTKKVTYIGEDWLPIKKGAVGYAFAKNNSKSRPYQVSFGGRPGEGTILQPLKKELKFFK